MAGAFSLSDKVKCAERELVQRRRVYPRLIQSGRMRQEQADHEIACMAAIAEDLRARLVADALRDDLFGGQP